ncbi:xanthine dehydrogenase subunit XdhC [Salidesulfovibrio onnuriiensis]|uniref:xanthine dehydrogenase subunit XdhC n=1 Tax=Salidesulfovibrio onnuriiensis TaxID=2583823 RepID=UPI0011CA6FB6|nr:xanthine dehydrogenase subunit XdhC [Salidesulfovibrio onnuriiensis]
MKKQTINLTVNGKEFTLDVDVRKSLADVLREQGFTSVKQGCGVGECGACTVLVDDVAVDSCIFLAMWANGKKVRTTEGECKNGKLSPVQQAYVEAGAVQCGFCTPGLIMTTTSFLERNKGRKVTREEIRKGHAGNLCRCTGYETIVKAVESVVEVAEEE